MDCASAVSRPALQAMSVVSVAPSRVRLRPAATAPSANDRAEPPAPPENEPRRAGSAERTEPTPPPLTESAAPPGRRNNHVFKFDLVRDDELANDLDAQVRIALRMLSNHPEDSLGQTCRAEVELLETLSYRGSSHVMPFHRVVRSCGVFPHPMRPPALHRRSKSSRMFSPRHSQEPTSEA